MDAGLKKRVVLVTGGSGGIGSAIVRSMVAEGANVAIHYHRGEDRANDLVQELANAGVINNAGVIKNAGVISVGADLRDENQVKQMFADVESKLGPIDVLIANAGVWPQEDTPLREMPLERWHETINVDLNTVFLCVREHLLMVERHHLLDPSTVVIGSTAGCVGEAGHADYASAKSAMMYGLVQSLKNEIARQTRFGRINAVCPGWTMTPMAEKFTGNQDGMIRALQTIPMKKFASPADIANAVTFLSSPKLAGHITGQTLFVSGGMEGRVLNSADEIDLKAAMPPSS